MERQQQRAISATQLFLQQEKNENLEVFGVSLDLETLQDWLIFDVLLSSKNGQHKMLKVCLTQDEAQVI